MKTEAALQYSNTGRAVSHTLIIYLFVYLLLFSIQKLDANETDKELTKSKRQIFMYSLLCIFLYMGLGLVFLYFVEKWR